MPIYMDVHNLPGVKARDVAEAHNKDVQLQEEYGCKCMTYWIDEERGNVFCLIDAPDKEVVSKLHSKAHGLVPHKIIEVNSNIVTSFLGRIYDPEEVEISDTGLKIFHDPSYRTLLVAKIFDTALLEYKLGKEKKDELLKNFYEVLKKQSNKHDGREVAQNIEGIILSFTSACKAILCALDIINHLKDEVTITGLKIGINGGEPVMKSENLFGDTIALASNLCLVNTPTKIAITYDVKTRAEKEGIELSHQIKTLEPADEAALETIYNCLEKNWHNPDFTMAGFCKKVAISKSQLYRKTIDLWGLSPNVLLKDFRLQKAKELMKKKRYNISQITFDSGFTSPSYFTKCFKKKYGLVPMDYLDLLH